MDEEKNTSNEITETTQSDAQPEEVQNDLPAQQQDVYTPDADPMQAPEPAGRDWDAEDDGSFISLGGEMPEEEEPSEESAEQQPASPEEQTPSNEPNAKKGFSFKALLERFTHKKENEPALRFAQTDSQEPVKSRTVRIAQAQKRRSMRRFRTIAIITVVLALIVAKSTGMLSGSIAKLSDTADDIRIGLTPSRGYPLRTNITEIYCLAEMSGGFLELGKEDLLLYSASGSRLRSIQHGYTRPAVAVGKSRFCLYNRGGNDLRVESRSQTIYSTGTDEALLLCAISDNGTLAVCTRSRHYAADISVYNAQMSYIYGWSPTEATGTPACMAFSPDSKKLASANLRVHDGKVVTSVCVLNLNKAEQPMQTEETEGTILHLSWIDGSHLLALFNDHAAIYNPTNGKIRETFDFENRTLLAYDVSANGVALLFSGGNGLGSFVQVLDTGLKIRSDAITERESNSITLTHNLVYTLNDKGIEAFDAYDGSRLWFKECDSRPLAVLNTKNLLLFSGIQAQILEAPPVEKPEEETVSSSVNSSDEDEEDEQEEQEEEQEEDSGEEDEEEPEVTDEN